MNKKNHILIIFAFSLFVFQAQAQRFAGTSLGFRGMSGYLGFGVAEYSVINPTSEFRMDQGTMVYMGGEKELGQSGLFITI